MSPTPIHYCMDHAGHFPYLSMNSYSNSNNCGSHHPPSIYFIIQFQETQIAVSELLTCNVRKSFISSSEALACVSSCLVLGAGLTSSYSGQHPPPQCVLVSSRVSLSSLLESLDLLSEFVKLHALVCFLVYKV